MADKIELMKKKAWDNLEKCRLKAVVDFQSGSPDEEKRIVVGYVPGRGLHTQAELKDPGDGKWYPISRKWALDMPVILGTYTSVDAALASGWFGGR